MVRAQQEECAELHFAKVKAPFAGVPCIRDGVLSTHHHHLAMAASKEKTPSVEHPTATQLSDEQTSHISKDALKSACLLQSALVVGRSAQDVYQTLQSVWNDIQRTLLTSEADEGQVEDDDCFEECAPEDVEDVEDWSKVIRALSSIEHLSGAHNETSDALPHSSAHESAKVHDDALMMAVAPSGHDMCAKSVLQSGHLLGFKSPSDDTLDKCIHRSQQLLAPIRAFVAAVSILAKLI